VASRLACGVEPFQAACEGVWLHGEAARQALAPFSAGELANSVAKAYRACL
jgi:NAD(P)H-hydrate repair Nnr-like enzyme with NAD(P)H-hydrate dehydratase domain